MTTTCANCPRRGRRRGVLPPVRARGPLPTVGASDPQRPAGLAAPTPRSGRPPEAPVEPPAAGSPGPPRFPCTPTEAADSRRGARGRGPAKASPHSAHPTSYLDDHDHLGD